MPEQRLQRTREAYRHGRSWSALSQTERDTVLLSIQHGPAYAVLPTCVDGHLWLTNYVDPVACGVCGTRRDGMGWRDAGDADHEERTAT